MDDCSIYICAFLFHWLIKYKDTLYSLTLTFFCGMTNSFSAGWQSQHLHGNRNQQTLGGGHLEWSLMQKSNKLHVSRTHPQIWWDNMMILVHQKITQNIEILSDILPSSQVISETMIYIWTTRFFVAAVNISCPDQWDEFCSICWCKFICHKSQH